MPTEIAAPFARAIHDIITELHVVTVSAPRAEVRERNPVDVSVHCRWRRRARYLGARCLWLTDMRQQKLPRFLGKFGGAVPIQRGFSLGRRTGVQGTAIAVPSPASLHAAEVTDRPRKPRRPNQQLCGSSILGLEGQGLPICDVQDEYVSLLLRHETPARA
jgi:hypothetical protein